MLRIKTGKDAETRACHYLSKQGHTIIKRNYHSRFGEIDIIVKKGQQLIFVEVRQRRSNACGGALMSVTKGKQQKITHTALQFIQAHREYHSFDCRFDVVAFQGDPPELQWIKNAFGQ